MPVTLSALKSASTTETTRTTGSPASTFSHNWSTETSWLPSSARNQGGSPTPAGREPALDMEGSYGQSCKDVCPWSKRALPMAATDVPRVEAANAFQACAQRGSGAKGPPTGSKRRAYSWAKLTEMGTQVFRFPWSRRGDGTTLRRSATTVKDATNGHHQPGRRQRANGSRSGSSPPKDPL